MSAVPRAPSGILGNASAGGFSPVPHSTRPRGCAKVESRVLQGTEGRAASMLPVCPHVKPQCNLMLMFSTSSILSLF